MSLETMENGKAGTTILVTRAAVSFTGIPRHDGLTGTPGEPKQETEDDLDEDELDEIDDEIDDDELEDDELDELEEEDSQIEDEVEEVIEEEMEEENVEPHDGSDGPSRLARQMP